MSERLDRLEGFGITVRNNTRAGIAATGRELGAAETVRGSICTACTLFERYDHLLTPTMAVPPFPVEQNYPETVAGKAMRTYVDWLAPTFVHESHRIAGGVGTLRPRYRRDAGRLQIVGRPEGEEAVLALAAIQELFPDRLSALGNAGQKLVQQPVEFFRLSMGPVAGPGHHFAGHLGHQILEVLRCCRAG